MSDAQSIDDVLRDELSSLGLTALVGYVDSDQLNRISESGIEINSSLLADLIISKHGLSIFGLPTIRIAILQKYGLQKINRKLGTNFLGFPEVEQFNNFRWGENEKSQLFLSILGLFDVDLESRQVRSIDVDLLNVASALHPYQNWIRKRLFEFLIKTDHAKVVMHMPTGSGKTRTTLEAVCDFLRTLPDSCVTVVWFAHSEELCEQAAESIGSIWHRLGAENAKIVRLWGGRQPALASIDGPTFVISSFQTAYKLLAVNDDDRISLFTKIRRKCAILVVDEAHQAIAPTYRQAIDLFSNRTTKIVGLTATPGRHHINGSPEQTLALSDYFENHKIDIVDNEGLPLDDPISFLTEQGILSRVDKYQIRSSSDVVLTDAELRQIEKQLDIPSSVLARLGDDKNRTNLIATNALKLAVDRGKQTIVFAPSKDNAIELALLCSTKGCRSASITGDTDKARRRELINEFRSGKIKILTNFGVLTTGFDAPNIEAVVIARPTTSVVLYSQMIGRGMRGPKMGGSEDCILVDVIDNILNMPSAPQAFNFFNDFF